MSQYRDEREAMRLRVETLEAKLRERDAALAARETELSEREAEIERLRKAAGKHGGGLEGTPPNSTARVLVVAGIAFAVLVMGGMTVGLVAMQTSAEEVAPPLPAPPPPMEVAPESLQSLAAPMPLPAPSPSGTYTQAILKKVREASPRVRACYQKELAKDPELSIRIMTTLDIEADGSVSRVSLSKVDPERSELNTCITNILKTLKFPPPESGKTTVNTPFVLTPGSVNGDMQGF